MKRLNHRQLDARIHNFMQRKMEEFPELRDETATGVLRDTRRATDEPERSPRFMPHRHLVRA